MKWEYKVAILLAPKQELYSRLQLIKAHSEQINDPAWAGWELVSVDNGVAYFKRLSQEYLEQLEKDRINARERGVFEKMSEVLEK